MKKSFTLFILTLVICFFTNYKIQAQDVPPVTIHVETAGTLSSLISSEKKYIIEELTLSGNLNGADFSLIRQMAGGGLYESSTTSGKLNKLNLANANIVSGSVFSYFDNYRTQNNTISEYMFAYLSNLTSLILPNSATSIEQTTFTNCKGLTSIIIPDKVASIGASAFEGCTGLTNVTIGASVNTIEGGSFFGCTNLKEFFVAKENLNYTTFESVLFNIDKTQIVAYPNAKSAIYEIPNSVTSIGRIAFGGCIGLTNITIPQNVTTIAGFNGCTGLTSIKIPDNVTSIMDGTFNGCTGLTSISIPDGVESINYNTFYGCTGLSLITIGRGVSSIGEDALKNCTGLKEIFSNNPIPPKVDKTAFYGIQQSMCNLYVPKGSYSNYWASSGWGGFNVIEGPIYRIQISSTTGGTVTKSSLSVKEGGSVIFTITPNTGYRITSATLNSKNIITEIDKNTYTIMNVSENLSLNVIFEVIPNYEVSVTHNLGGKIYINESIVTSGNKVSVTEKALLTFMIKPDENYAIEKVLLNGKDITNQLQTNSYTLNVNSHQILSVTFVRTHCNLFINTNKEGKVLVNDLTASDTIRVEINKPLTLKITPNWGYNIASVLLNKIDITSEIVSNAYTYLSGLEDITLDVIFKGIETATVATQQRIMEVYTEQGSIIIKRGKLGEIINVYSVSGTLLHSTKVTEDNVRIKVSPGNFYLVKAGNRTFKVAL